MSLTPYIIGSVTVAGGGTTAIITPSTATAAGDTIVLAFLQLTSGYAIYSVTDSAGNVYTQQILDTTEYVHAVYVSPGPTGGSSGGPTAALSTSSSITVTYAASNEALVVAVGCSGLLKVDQHNVSSSSSGNAPSVSVTTLGQPEVGIAFFVTGYSNAANVTWGTGWNRLYGPTETGSLGAYQNVAYQDLNSAPGTVTASASMTGASAKYSAVLLTFFTPVTVTTTNLPDAVISQVYSTTLAATGGASGAGYVWSLATGGLPAGLSMTSGGIISGSPSALGTYDFSVVAADDLSNQSPPQPLDIAVDQVIFYPGICQTVVHPITGVLVPQYPVSQVFETAWNIDERISAYQAAAWNISQQKVSAFQQTAWNTTTRVKSSTFAGVYGGLCGPVVRPIDDLIIIPGSTWNVDGRTSVSQEFAWDVTKRITSDFKTAWNVRIIQHTEQALAWKVLKRIYIPGPARIGYNGICQAVVHPIDSVNYPPASPSYAWRLNQRLSSLKKSAWEVRVPVKAQKAVAWNTEILTVTKTQAFLWNLHEKLSPQKAVAWRLNQRTYRRQAVAWELRSKVTTDKAAAWNVLHSVHVLKIQTTNYGLCMPVVHPIDQAKTTTTEFDWNLHQRLDAAKAVRFNVYDRLEQSTKQFAWNTLTRIYIPNVKSTYYNGICQSVVHPIRYYKQIPWQPQFQWRFINAVTSTVAVEWRTLKKVSPQVTVEWHMNQRLSALKQSLFMTRSKVTSTTIMEWNIGQPIQSQIRQTAVSRLDFAY